MHPRGAVRPGFWLVFQREVLWLRRRRPGLLVLVTILPLTLMGLMTAIFSTGIPTRLPIAVLDLDGSDLSRSIVRMVDATPDTAVTRRVADLSEGRTLILDGSAYGLLMIPRDLERNVVAGRRPEVVFFYNTQQMTTGNLVLRGVNAAVLTAAAGVRLSLRTAQGQETAVAEASINPIPVQTHALFNPTLNYIHFLLAALLPAVIQIVVVTASAYSVGLDFDTRHRLMVLRRLGGGMWPAMAGKMVPYTIIFLALMGIADYVEFAVYGLPLNGNRWMLLLAGVSFVLACQFLGVLLTVALRSTANAVAIGSLLTAPAFGYMGIGFPFLGMNGFSRAFGSILPATWYMMARIDQTIRGTPLDLSWPPVLILLAFVAGTAGLTAWLLEGMRLRRQRARMAGRPA